jgi:hypothetical protein
MKGLLALAATTVALAGFQGAASAGSRYAYAVGGAERSADAFSARHVAFSAHNGPKGTTGEFTSHAATLDFTAAVTCLFVDGNRAVIGAVIRNSSDAGLVGDTVFVAFEDNGNPGRGASTDRVSAYLFEAPPVSDTCATEISLYATFAPVTSGNVLVQPGT